MIREVIHVDAQPAQNKVWLAVPSRYTYPYRGAPLQDSNFSPVDRWPRCVEGLGVQVRLAPAAIQAPPPRLAMAKSTPALAMPTAVVVARLISLSLAYCALHSKGPSW